MSGVIESRLEKADQEADKLLGELYSGEPPTDTPPVDGKPDGYTPPAAVDGDGGPGKDGVAAPLDAEPPKGDEPPPKKADLSAEEETYKHRFEVVDGMLKAEVPRLNAELAQWKEFASGLQARITVLEEAAKAKPTPAVDDLPPEDDYETEAFISDNPGAAKLFKKLEAKHKAELATLRDEIKSVGSKAEAKVSEFQQTTALDRFESAMSSAGVPEWRTIDSNPGFAAWLNQNPYNTQVLQAAAAKFDAKTVSAYFLDYKRSLNPGGNGDGNGDEPPVDKGGKLDKFTAPPRSGGEGRPPKSDTQPALTKANYEKFMHQTAIGKFKPHLWGGLTEAQLEVKFDDAIAKGALL